MTARVATITLNPAIDQTVSIPNFHPNAVNRVNWKQDDAGGKGVNVASFLSSVGHSVSVSGFLGQENASLFERLFQEKGITDYFVRIPGDTRINIKIVDDAQGEITDINYPGQQPRDEDVQTLQKVITTLAQDCDWLIFSGSVPAGVSTNIYDILIRPLKALGKTVVLDTSGEALRHGLQAKPDLIKPNQVELEEILGRSLSTPRDIVAAAHELIDAGTPYIVVSMGADGALFIDRDQVVHAQPPTVDIKSTVGAGDAMVAGTVAGLVNGQSLMDCAALATAFSMGALSQIGPRLPPIDVLHEMRDRVTIRPLSI